VSRPVRDVGAVALAVALGGIAVWSLGGCGESHSTQSPITQSRSSEQSQDRAVAAAEHFLERYVKPDGRVARIDQGGDTVGEGQAYGMLLAAAIGDRQRFEKIWAWTQSNLRRPDGLLEFLWQNGRVVDPQAASDADLDASRALLVGACRFHEPSLRRQAIQMGSAIMRVEVASPNGTPVLTAGPWAVAPPITLNPSYFSPATDAALGAASGDSRWAKLSASSRAITSNLMSGSARLPPDWARLEGGRPVPIGSPSAPQSRPEFSFDAVRTLVRMAEDPDPAGRRIAAAAWPVFAREDPTRMPVQHALSGRPIGDVIHPVILVSAAGAADAAGQLGARDGLLDEAEALDRHSPTYYGAAWVGLGRIMLTTKLLDACS
jgi:endo-1,4-beta-D-glucanase Y